jgi:hypothetical protein
MRGSCGGEPADGREISNQQVGPACEHCGGCQIPFAHVRVQLSQKPMMSQVGLWPQGWPARALAAGSAKLLLPRGGQFTMAGAPPLPPPELVVLAELAVLPPPAPPLPPPPSSAFARGPGVLLLAPQAETSVAIVIARKAGQAIFIGRE